jgi:hypothetical protein
MATTMKVLLASLLLAPALAVAAPGYWLGANVKMAGDAAWGSELAQESMNNLAESGAEKALLVAFTWQAEPGSSNPVIGSDSDPETVRAGLRQMREAGLEPILKTHLWIPEHWAGDAKPDDRAQWFQSYQQAVVEYAQLASDEGISAFIVGSELRGLETSAYWPALVHAVRQVYSGKVLYVADGLDRAESFRYWTLFDAVGTSLYPSLSEDPETRGNEMAAAVARLQELGRRHDRPVWVAEVGVRSAEGSLSAPWKSPEQQELPVDLALQKNILDAWLTALDQPGIEGVGIWCWYTDPAAGGEHDTDFTVQHKPAQAIFRR